MFDFILLNFLPQILNKYMYVNIYRLQIVEKIPNKALWPAGFRRYCFELLYK